LSVVLTFLNKYILTTLGYPYVSLVDGGEELTLANLLDRHAYGHSRKDHIAMYVES